MKLALDTNVVLDVLLARAEFVEAAQAVMYEIESGKSQGVICATTLTMIHYLSAKAAGVRAAQRNIALLLRLFEIAPVNRNVLELAVVSKQRDFEDAVLAHSVSLASAEVLITRNPKDFLTAPLRLATPMEWLARAL